MTKLGSPSSLSPSGVETAELTLRPLEQKVADRARQFTLPALIDVLHFLGYSDDDIEWKSEFSLSHRSSLVERIEFILLPRRLACVTLNIGLLAAQSPLPSYFLKIAESHHSDTFNEFIGYFDHVLLRERARALYPERDLRVLPSWPRTLQRLFRLLGRRAPATLHWLFKQVYPELGVRVSRSLARQPLATDGVKLGSAVLGNNCSFGGTASVPVGGILVTLYCEETHTPTGVPWAIEASSRLEKQVLYALRDLELHLSVNLIFFERQTWAELSDDQYLGYERMWQSKEAAKRNPTQQVLLFDGSTAEGAGRRAEGLRQR